MICGAQFTFEMLGCTTTVACLQEHQPDEWSLREVLHRGEIVGVAADSMGGSGRSNASVVWATVNWPGADS